MVELLSPVGDFECLKAAVQNGADSVYFGGNMFNARANAANFDNNNLKKAIQYAKLRNVKVDFTLNTLLKDTELSDAVKLANYIYSLGADAIIVQDLGLAKILTKNLPDIAIHASTQMTIHNLDGVLEAEKLGFKRVVLSRELSLKEIEYICKHSNIEIETFIHGALCISYSGQCLLSSAIGGRSGNRGNCAQPCRLKYELIESNNKKIDSGYLLSPRDLCGLKYIPELIKFGVKCFKIEGRMKTPEYVATVTKIYRKYIDLALSNKKYEIDSKDIETLLQVFNRGGFSDGNFEDSANSNYVFKEKSNNMGLLLGEISNYNPKKGYVSFKSSTSLEIGDKISVENSNYKYSISELIKNNQNIKKSSSNDFITIGRLKGNIKPGYKIYKLTNSSFFKEISDYLKSEHIKIDLSARLIIKKDNYITLKVKTNNLNLPNYYKNISVSEISDIKPSDAINNPITKDRLITQLNKTTDTPYQFKNINIEMDENIYVPISIINKLRRDCLKDVESQAIKNFSRNSNNNIILNTSNINKLNKNTKISLLLNELNLDYNYLKLEKIDFLYIPFKYFLLKDYSNLLLNLSKITDIYIYLPPIMKNNFTDVLSNKLDNLIKNYKIKGIVYSNFSNLYNLKKYKNKLNLIANFNLNIFNNESINLLKDGGTSIATLSPELDKNTLIQLAQTSPIPTEMLVYGKLPVMNCGYCAIGKANHCSKLCNKNCQNKNKYYLKDRMKMNFELKIDNMQTITTIYNSKITSISYSDIPISNARISILDENIEEINNIIKHVKKDTPFTGSNYTNGNLNKLV